MREAPSLVLAGRLVAEGADGARVGPGRRRRRGAPRATICAEPLEALAGADAAVLVTEWPQLAELDWSEAAARMRNPLLIDGRNMLDPAAMRAGRLHVRGHRPQRLA